MHMVPHSHDDVGWRKTVDQYFSGSHYNFHNCYCKKKMTIKIISYSVLSFGFGRVRCVKCILDTVTEELEKDPERR